MDMLVVVVLTELTLYLFVFCLYYIIMADVSLVVLMLTEPIDDTKAKRLLSHFLVTKDGLAFIVFLSRIALETPLNFSNLFIASIIVL